MMKQKPSLGNGVNVIFIDYGTTVPLLMYIGVVVVVAVISVFPFLFIYSSKFMFDTRTSIKTRNFD